MQTAYEAIYIMDTNLSDEQVTATVDKYSGVVTRSGGVIDDIDRLEPRRLAYEVKGRREGLYVIMNFTSEPSAKDELDRIFRISDDVFRHLIVKQDKKADRFPSKTRSAETERQRERDSSSRAGSVTDLGSVTVPHPDVAPPAPSPAVDVDDTPTTVTDTPDGMETSAEATEAIREDAGSPA